VICCIARFVILRSWLLLAMVCCAGSALALDKPEVLIETQPAIRQAGRGGIRSGRGSRRPATPPPTNRKCTPGTRQFAWPTPGTTIGA